MSFLRKKTGSYPKNLSFEPEVWGWLQRKRRHDGMLVPLSAVVTKILTDIIANEKRAKKISTRSKAKSKPNRVASSSERAAAPHKWNLEINDTTPLWVRSLAKKLETP